MENFSKLLWALVLVMICLTVYGMFTGDSFVVLKDYAKDEVVEILDVRTGEPVQVSFEELERTGKSYEVIYVQPLTMK